MVKLPIVRESLPNGVVYRDDFLGIDFGLIPTGGKQLLMLQLSLKQKMEAYYVLGLLDHLKAQAIFL
ncbi:hypothetical protein HMPREF9318_00801 [Streptococcus urinalis FB127-CNA-2]|nr:hypothetical protein HMPREF9318_00801 [Streptococcus urinalis FB127-CNA-2]VEF32372.1 Uncharacterised protein [Streptococcus urinalis]